MANYHVDFSSTVIIVVVVVSTTVYGVVGWSIADDNDTTLMFPLSLLPPSETHTPMSPTLRPQYIFSIHSNNTVFAFDILAGVEKGYRLSVMVERIWCHGLNNHLVLEGQEREGEVTRSRSLKLCIIEDNADSWWQSVDNIVDGLTVAEVKAEGDWSGLYAQLIVSIYNEVDGGCENCGSNSFCCGLSSRNDKRRTRCIPNSGVCNHHPNCGLYANADESEAICSPRGECIGPECDLAGVALRIALLVLFCFLLPPTLILLACRFSPSRRLCDRVNQVIINRCQSGRNVQDGDDPTFRPQHEQSVTAAYIAEEDQPPSYEDFLRSQPVSVILVKEAPPPTFDQATIATSLDQGGAVNPAFVLDEDSRR